MWFQIVDIEKAMRCEVYSTIVLVQCLFLAVVESDAILQADYLFIGEEKSADG